MVNTAKKIVTAAGIVTFVIGVFTASAVQAHNTLKASSPAEGAVVQESPAVVTLNFSDNTWLTGMMLHTPEGKMMNLKFTPSIEAASSFSVALPEGLAEGSYMLMWNVEGEDTHKISGTINFSVGMQTKMPGGSTETGSATGQDNTSAGVTSHDAHSGH